MSMGIKSKSISTKFWCNTLTGATQTTRPQSDSNWEHWDSKQEYHLYQKLSPLAKKYGLSLVRQFPITIHDSHTFGKVKWKCDFMLFFGTTPIIPIEFKGDWVIKKANALGSFKYQMTLLEISKPTLFESLILIGSEELAKRLPKLRIYQTDAQVDAFLASRLIRTINTINHSK